MSLKLGELVAYLRTDNNQFRAGLAEGEREFKRAGAGMEKDATATGRALSTALAAGGIGGGDGFVRDATGRLHDGRGRFVAEGAALGAAAGKAAGAGVRVLASGTSNLTGAMKALGSGVSGVIPWLLGLAAAGVFLVPVLYAVGGAAGAIPALIAGGGAAVGTLMLGFMGLSDAFKKTSASGGSVVDRAYQIAQAERRVRDANEEVLAAQLALNRAREDAVENLQDLNRELGDAQVDSSAAALAVIAAQRDLERAMAKGDPFEIEQARVQLAQAERAVLGVQDRVEDLTIQQQRAAQAGVEGSDQVQQALTRQRQAVESVGDAQHALAEAQKPSGGGGASAEVTKLAASALAAVAAIKSLKPAFESLRLDVQEKLFAGVGEEILRLSDAWMPTLRTRLGSMSSMFNGLFKSWAETSRKPEFIANIAAGWEHVEKLIDRVGKAIVGPGLEAFGKLSRAAGPFIDALGDGIAGIVEDFSTWIDEADRSGSLKSFFERAGDFLTAVIDIGKDAASIVGSIISILFKAEDKNPGSEFETFHAGMDKLAKWFKDPTNQQKLTDFVTSVEDFLFWIKDTAIPTIVDWGRKLDDWADRLTGWAKKASDFKDGVVKDVTAIGDSFTGLPGRIGAAASGMWDPIKAGFKIAFNWIIGKWNALSFTIPSFRFLGYNIDGFTLRVPPIAALAKGGVVPATPGGRLALLGEGGEDEIVAPEGKLRRMLADALSNAGGQLTIVLETRGLIRDQKRRIRWQGGDVQLSLGTG